jgi:hypothetical protein
MIRRVVATALWFVSMWALGSAIGYATNFGDGILAPVMAFASAGLVAVDPLNLFWTRTHRGRSPHALPPQVGAATIQLR